MSSTAVVEAPTRTPMSEMIPMIDDFVAEAYAEYPNCHGSFERGFNLSSGHNRVLAFEDIMQEVRIILARMLIKMSAHNDRVFMDWLEARELRLLNKTGARIDPDDFDPYLADEHI